MDITNFTVTCNTDNGKIFYRFFNDFDKLRQFNNTSKDWVFYGPTINGTISVDVGHNIERFFQVGILFDGGFWSDDIRINSITITKSNFIEYLYTDIFYLDTPTFDEPPAPRVPKVKCKGRDIYKRAIENEVNLKDLTNTPTGDTPIDQLIKDVCDSIGIPYSDTSIENLDAFIPRMWPRGLKETKKASEVFELIMQFLNQKGKEKYQMFVEYDPARDESVLHVKTKPFQKKADFIFNHVSFQRIGSKRKNYDKLLKSISTFSEKNQVNEEIELDSVTFVDKGLKEITWFAKRSFKRYEIKINSGKPNIELIEVTPLDIKFNIESELPFSARITVYGSKWKDNPLSQGEAINHKNMLGKRGNNIKIENPLLINDDEAKVVAEGFVEEFGEPVIEARGLDYPYLNLMLNINTMTMIWSRFIFLSNLYFITGVKYKWNDGKSPRDSTSFNLDDSGSKLEDISNFIYDEVLEYNIGYVYDMKHGQGVTREKLVRSGLYQLPISVN